MYIKYSMEITGAIKQQCIHIIVYYSYVVTCLI